MLLTPKPEPNRSDEASRARLAVSRQAPKVVRVAYRDAEGRAHMARIDERRLHLETQRQLAALEASRPALHAEARAAANAQLDEVFARLQGDERVSLLADWYYAYTTAYELLGVGRGLHHDDGGRAVHPHDRRRRRRHLSLPPRESRDG